MSRVAIISDIHSNLEALEAVLRAADADGIREIHCLGDIVGYGTNPAECVDIVSMYCAAVVRGNHDEAVATGRGIDYLPTWGAEAARHNREMLSEDHLDYLAGLPLRLEVDGMTLVHATPDRPEAWRRLHSFKDVRAQFAAFETDICFVGHTHIPGTVGERLGSTRVRPGSRFIVNVGSVGQPRDNDRRACLGIFDLESFTYELRRIPYNYDAAARKVEAAGLTSRLDERLGWGS